MPNFDFGFAKRGAINKAKPPINKPDKPVPP
jgi:hypothetical protein